MANAQLDLSILFFLTYILSKTISFCLPGQFSSDCVHGVLLWRWWDDDTTAGVGVDKFGVQLQEVLESSVNCVFILGSGFLPDFRLNSKRESEKSGCLAAVPALHIDLTQKISYVSV